MILKSQQRFRIEKRNVFTEKIDKIALKANDDKRIQSVNSIETCKFETSKDLVCKTEGIKCINTIKQYKNFDDATKENIKKYNLNWPQILDHSRSINNWRFCI